MTSMRGKLSYANVVATLALVLAVAGIPSAAAITAGKVKKNSITSKQIKPGAIRASDLASGAVSSAKLADRSVTASKLGPVRQVNATNNTNSLTIAQCAANERLISGGGFSSPMTTNAPFLDLAGGEAWQVSGGANTVASAVCLSPTPGH